MGRGGFQGNNKFKVSRGRGNQSKREILIGNVIAREKKKDWAYEREGMA